MFKLKKLRLSANSKKNYEQTVEIFNQGLGHEEQAKEVIKRNRSAAPDWWVGGAIQKLDYGFIEEAGAAADTGEREAVLHGGERHELGDKGGGGNPGVGSQAAEEVDWSA